MRSEKASLAEISDDLRLAPGGVVYLEGTTDPDILFSLLGVVTPADGVHAGVLVVGLRGSKKSTGSKAVKNLTEIAERYRILTVFGIVDGDGRSVGELSSQFDAPFRGPSFSWKAYCIENLLVQTGWPAAWGDEPDWKAELEKYGPYVALNRMTKEVGQALVNLGIEQHSNPNLNRPLLQAAEALARLSSGKNSLVSYDLEENFRRQISNFVALVTRGSDEVHALLNGKWIVEHMAPTITGRTPNRCRQDWIDHARTSGGLPEVRQWWDRITNSPA